MLYDLSIHPYQGMRLRDWLEDCVAMADIELRIDDDVLTARQGDVYAAWNPDGNPVEPITDERPSLRDIRRSTAIGRMHDTLVQAVAIRERLIALREDYECEGAMTDEALSRVLDAWDEFEQHAGTADDDAPPTIVHVVAPNDPDIEPWVFEREEDAERFEAVRFGGEIGVTRCTVIDPGLAQRMIIEEEEES